VTRKPGGCAGSGIDTDVNNADFDAPATPIFHATGSAPATSTPVALNDGPICEGATLRLTASTIAGAAYSWTGPNGFASSDQNPIVTNAAAAASGVYTVTVNGCTSATTVATVIASGASCDDGSACTIGDLCAAGSCAGTPVACGALDQCHVAGTCDTATGQCSNPDAPNGSACSDGDPCTRTDTCQLGACVGANPVLCAPLDQCHDAGTCQPATGQCTSPAKADGSACDDGNACTIGDLCTAGSCAGTPGSAPAEVSDIVAAKSGPTVDFVWAATAGATAYDVLRGRLTDWPVGANASTESCLADNLTATTAGDGTAPGADEGFWYLVRAENACGAGSYGSRGSGGVPTVPRSSATCP
jgi:hypothetical protein